jgi:uncharacterized membrane protein YbhN (UPF0104 family)
MFDRVIGLVGMLVFPLMAALTFPAVARLHPAIVSILWWAAALSGSAALVAFLLWGPASRAWAARLLMRLPRGILWTRAALALRTFRQHRGPMAVALGLSLAATMLGVASMVLLARATGSTGSAQIMLVLLPVGSLINAIPLTPGGLGVGEVAMDRLFALAQLTGGATVLMSWRLLLLVPASVGLLLYVQGRADFIAAYPAPDAVRPERQDVPSGLTWPRDAHPGSRP